MLKKEIEKLSSEIHDVYQKEAIRQSNVRHPDNYEDLDEDVKEFDRVLARWILNRDRQLLELVKGEIEKKKHNATGEKAIAKQRYDNALQDALSVIDGMITGVGK